MTPSLTENPFHNIECLLIDLDDTLYPHNSGTWEQVRLRIDHFLIEEMHFPPEDVTALRARLFRQYGTTLRGLQIEYEVDMEHYLDFVHNIPLENHLSPDPELYQMLVALPQRKVIFTNASARHARRVIEILGVQGCFERIIDIHIIYPHCKPEVEAFQTALTVLQADPERTLLVDDTPANLVTARSLGLATVSIGLHRHDGSPHIPNLKSLPGLLTP
jgi:putative hydrolase of the HAD superfamily